MSDEEIDKLFRQKLQSYEDTPSAQVWKKISAELSPQKQSNSSTPRIWMAAASLVLLASLALLFLPGKPPVRLQASHTPETKPAEYKETPRAVTTKSHEPKGILFLERLASMKIEGNKRVKEYKKRGRAISENIAHITEDPQEESQTVSVSAAISQVDAPQIPVIEELSVEKASPGVVLALAEADQEQESIVRKEKIKSLGDIVNFFIRQVDPREEKIIEFTNHDEGSSVSSINLGLLKIKTKQNGAKLN